MPDGGSGRLTRQQRRQAARHGGRRPTDDEFRAAGSRDDCALCGRPLHDGEWTTIGYAGVRLVVVGDCCGSLIAEAWGFGVYFTAPTTWREDDRRWFAANPTRSHRLRRAFEAETVLGRAAPSWIAVRQIEPGKRQRLGFEPPGPLPNAEQVAHALFDTLADALAAGRDTVPLRDVIARVSGRGSGGARVTYTERCEARHHAATRRAEDLAIAVDVILRSVPAIDDLVRALAAAGGCQRLVRALCAELAMRRGRR
jgi:hypothetical protein